MNKRVHTFPKNISPKVNEIAQIEFELAYHGATVEHINHSAMGTPLLWGGGIYVYVYMWICEGLRGMAYIYMWMHICARGYAHMFICECVYNMLLILNYYWLYSDLWVL